MVTEVYRPKVSDEDCSIRNRVRAIAKQTKVKTYEIERQIFSMGLERMEKALVNRH